MSKKNPYLPEDFYEPELLTLDDDERSRPGCFSANFVTVVFLLLTVAFLVYFGTLLANPYLPINPFPPRTPLPVYVVATIDPNPPTSTPLPTKLADAPRLSTLAPTPTATATMTGTPLPTTTQVLVEPPSVPTNTRVPPTATLIRGSGSGQFIEGVFTPPPPGDPDLYTRAPYPFTVFDDAVTYIENPNGEGCRWASVAGSVTNLGGTPISGFAVHVVGEGIDEISFTGTAMTYGAGGFEVFLSSAPLRGQYTVRLLSQTGTPLSAEFSMQTSPICEENVAIVNFVQNYLY